MSARVQCRQCGRQIVPRVVIYQGVATHSLCPFCGAFHQQFVKGPGCFRGLFVFGVLVVAFLGWGWLANPRPSKSEPVSESVTAPGGDLVPRVDLRSKGD